MDKRSDTETINRHSPPVRLLRAGSAALFFLCCLLLPLGAEVLQEIVVKDGDTLWSVATFYLKDPRLWPEVLKHNSQLSSDPNVLLPGMRIRVPIILIKENLRAAHLIYLLNDVRFRRKAQAEWKKAVENMELFNEDGLRTLPESRARVKFSSGEMLQLDENSLIILRPEQKREEIDLLSGGVRASQTRILASGSMVAPRIEPRGARPDFRTKVKEDKTTLVEVYEGIVDVASQGKTVTVTKGYGTEVKFRQPPSLPRALPPSPDLKMDVPTKMPGTNITASGKLTQDALQLTIRAPEVQEATPAKGARNETQQNNILGQMVTRYHLQIATSTTFGNPVADEINRIKERVNIDFKQYQLRDGVYYYRFAYVDELGFEGQYASPVQFTIDTTPPVIRISSPANESEVDTEFVHVSGTTEPGSRLKVDNKTVDVDARGGFTTAVMPKKGRNVIAFSAEDRAGNAFNTELVITKVKAAQQQTQTTASPETRKLKEKGKSLASYALGTLTAAVIVGVVSLIFL